MTDSTDSPAVLTLSDECTIYEVTQLREQILALIQANKNIEFDLSAVSLIDASGVQLLLASKVEMEQKGLCFNLTNCSEQVTDFVESIHCDEKLLMTRELDLLSQDVKGESHG